MKLICVPFYVVSLVLVFHSCQKEQSELQNPYFPFKVLGGAETGIDFNNTLEYKDDLNIIEYLYYYNGGGVAVGDIDGDGLEDLYFSSNQGRDRLFKNQGSLDFIDITEQANLDQSTSWSTGVTMEDINGDGLLDIYVCKVGNYNSLRAHNLVYINQGNGTFLEMSKGLGLDFSGFSTQAAFLDYDLDGDMDMYLLNHNVHSINSYGSIDKRYEVDSLAGDRFYENQMNETGKFVDKTLDTGIYSSPLGYGLALGIADINDDGWPDIYVGNDFHENDYIYLNNQDGTFTESLHSLITHTSRFTMGVDIADLDGDNKDDIYTTDMMPYDAEIFLKSAGEDSDNLSRIKANYGFAPQFARNTLQIKNEFGWYDEMALLTDTYATDWSWGVLLYDFDNDQLNDIFISNGIAKRPNNLDYINFISNIDFSVYQETQERETEQSIIDQMPEVKIPNFLFKNKGNLSFSEHQHSRIGTSGYSTGAAVGDLDLDGDLDLVLNNIDQEAQILENLNENSNSLLIHLEGTALRPNVLGSKVTVYLKGKPYTQEMRTVRGFQSSSTRRVHFGLGNHQRVDSLRIVWPGNYIQKIDQARYGMVSIQRADGLGRVDAGSPVEISYTISELPFIHIEDPYYDESYETLVPERLSREGPAVVYQDLNGDGVKDFYIGGARGQPSRVYLQDQRRNFELMENPDFLKDQHYEDVDAATIDLDKDGDLDLYVVSGGNDRSPPDVGFSDRIYFNDGNGVFSRGATELPQSNGSTISINDFDSDGVEDFFIGTRSITGNYGLSPLSYIVKNRDSRSMEIIVKENWGMITDSRWADINGDGVKDLVLVGDWMPITILINEGDNVFIDKTKEYGLNNSNGLWNCVEVFDYDGNGLLDIIAGNVGENFKWKTSDREMVSLYLDDFDGNQQLDPIIMMPFFGSSVPFHSRDVLGSHMPRIKKDYPSYLAFSKFGSIENILRKDTDQVMEIKHLKELRSMIFYNQGDTFLGVSLPQSAQKSSIEDIIIDTKNGDITYVGNTNSFVQELGPILANPGGRLLNYDSDTKSFGSYEHFSLPIGTIAKRVFQLEDKSFIVITSSGKSYHLEKLN